MDKTEEAEHAGQVRAIALGVVALAVIYNALAGLNREMTGERMAWWLVLVGSALVSLTGLLTRMAPKLLMARLMNDELVRDHRRASYGVGFAATLAAGVAVVVVGDLVAYDAANTARLIVTAGLASALGSFAFLELRRGA